MIIYSNFTATKATDITKILNKRTYPGTRNFLTLGKAKSWATK